MRLLSPVEIKAKGVVSDVPMELSASYFPVSLRAMLVRDGDVIAPICKNSLYHRGSPSDISRDQIESIMQNAREILGARTISSVDSKSNSAYTIHARHFSWQSFDFDRGHLDNLEISQPVLFPLDHLLFRPELKRWDIVPKPGYLYFGCQVVLWDQGSSLPIHGSRYLAEYPPSYVIPKKGKPSRTESTDDEDFPFNGEYVGPIGDVIHTTNSRVISEELVLSESRWNSSCKVQLKKYVLETPIEFPQGFVHETARLLNRSKALSAVARKFSALINMPDLAHADSAKKKEKPFPLGEPDLVGPDVSWRKSEDPWFVQMVILARLCGGKFWKYSLGVLSARMGKEIPILET